MIWYISTGILFFSVSMFLFWQLGGKSVRWYIRGDNKWREAFMGLWILQVIFTSIYSAALTACFVVVLVALKLF